MPFRTIRLAALSAFDAVRWNGQSLTVASVERRNGRVRIEFESGAVTKWLWETDRVLVPVVA